MLIKSMTDLCSFLDDRYDKLTYFKNITKIVCEKDDKMASILSILVRNTLFGDNGLNIEEFAMLQE